MSGDDLRIKRQSAGVAGAVLCLRAGIGRNRLSSVERGYVRASEAELTRLGHALDDLILAKQTVAAAAARVGWPIQAI